MWSSEEGAAPPIIGDAKITINDANGNLVGDFTANQLADITITLPVDQTGGGGSGPDGIGYPKSVKEYGAKGDGSTDDTIALTAAFKSGYDILVPKGIYKITSGIQLTEGVNIYGEGNDSIILYYSSRLR